MSQKLEPDSLIKTYRETKRYPQMRIVPVIEQDLVELKREIRTALQAVAESASDSALLRAWHQNPFKKGRRPPCSDNDPVALLKRIAEQHEDVDILFPLHLTSANLVAGNPSKTILNRRSSFAKSYDTATDPLVQACDCFAESVDRYEKKLLFRFLQEVDARIDKTKSEEGLFAFDDLLVKTYYALTAEPQGATLAQAIRGRLSAALIDEFQDTDFLQYEIFKRVFEGRPWYIIGDPKQAIYGFRGADVYTYLKAKKSAEDNAYTLNTNWRSTAALVRAINLLFATKPRDAHSQTGSFLIDGIDFIESQVSDLLKPGKDASARNKRVTPLSWWRFRINKENDLSPLATVIEATKTEVIRLLQQEIRIGDKPVEPGDIAVLVNSNHQAEVVQQALIRVGVPAVVSQNGDIYQTEEMEQLIQVLRAITRPNRSDSVRVAVTTRIWGMDAPTLSQHNNDDAQWQRLIDLFNGLRDRWHRMGFMNMFEALLHTCNVRERFLSTVQGERRLTNLLHAAEIALHVQETRQLSPENLIDHLKRERQVGLQADQEARELRLETDDQAVHVITVHKSKGLQYRIVFCPLAWEGRSRANDVPAMVHTKEQVLCDFGSKALQSNQAKADSERLAEDMRKLYVALTRAKERCYLAWGIPGNAAGQKKVADSALTHLLQMHTAIAQAGDRVDLDSLYHTVQELVDSHSDLMNIRDIGDRCRTVLSGKREPDGALVEPRENQLAAEQLRTWQIISFSSLAKKTASELPDYDALQESVESRRAGEQSRGIHGFSAGAKTGICLHEILENVDYQKIDQPDTGELIEQKLVLYDLDKRERHPGTLLSDPIATVLQMVRSAIHSHLVFEHGGILKLDALPADRLNEWAFHCALTSVVPAALQKVFAAYAKGWIGQTYSERLATLGERAISGFLKGFVDLVCRQNGRFYLLDWKSNRLGDDATHYSAETIQSAMVQHDYILQYHLYVLALHRFLKRHQPGYRYESDFGGIAYAFLRGIADEASSTRGWFLDRPPLELIEAIDELLGSKERK